MKKVCIIGVDGQDGSYLADHYLKNNFSVVGIGRRSENLSENLIAKSNALFTYKYVDLLNAQALIHTLGEIKADMIIYCASSHGPSGFDYFKVANETFFINTHAPHICLNYCRKADGKCSFIYFSSIKVFNNSIHKLVDKDPWLCRQSTDLYSRSKLIVEDSIKFYRRVYGVNAAVIWLSNHESIRRIKSKYFLPNFVTQCYSALNSQNVKINVNTLDFYCDWGCANQFMEIIIDHSKKELMNDIFIGTGQFVLARELVRNFFEKMGYNYNDFVTEKFINKKAATIEKYSFNPEWLPNKKLQDNLLGPDAVLNKIYKDYTSYHNNKGLW
jgi:GDPmannose 4,6-dehydratase